MCSNLVVAPHPWVVSQLTSVLESRTGRIEDIDWPLEKDVRRVLSRQHEVRTRTIATRWRCEHCSNRSCSAG